MSDSDSRIVRAYLLLADISGYTSFLSQTELDHAHEILSDLLEVVLRRFEPLLTVHKIEGDAIFAYVPDSRLVRGETLLELIETTYAAFRERMKNVRRHTTCTCRACQSMPLLDLKFILHHGEFVVQHIGGAVELAGSDVNLVHRLLKNHVAELTGWHAYALLTAAALDSMQLHPAGAVPGIESYEHLGQVAISSVDLHACYEAFLQRRHVVVEEPDAYVAFSVDLPAPPEEVWSWMNEPEKRRQLAPDPHKLKFVPVLRPGGRTSAGATTHCVHGANVAMRETVLDWKPFDYFTVEQDSGPLGKVQATYRFEPLDQGRQTRMHVALKGSFGRLPAFLNRPLIRVGYTRFVNYPAVGQKLKSLLSQAAAPDPVPASPP